MVYHIYIYFPSNTEKNPYENFTADIGLSSSTLFQLHLRRVKMKLFPEEFHAIKMWGVVKIVKTVEWRLRIQIFTTAIVYASCHTYAFAYL